MYKDFIKETIEDCYKSLNLNCKLQVKFVDFFKAHEFECTQCMVRHFSAKTHELTLTNRLLKTIAYDGGDYFALAIYHEMVHILDYIKVIHTNLFNFNLCLKTYKKFEQKYVSVGFHFWTEYFAYVYTFRFAKLNDIEKEKITFSRLVDNYLKVINLNKETYNKKNLTYNEGKKYIAYVDSFIYLCSKYMASCCAGNSRVPRSKINKNKDYKKVYSILSKLEPKVNCLVENLYSRKTYICFFMLGKCICENIRWKEFKVGLIRQNGKIHSFY